jgi:hypothetical protein
VELRDSAPTLEQFGISHKQFSRWQKLAAVPAAKYEQAGQPEARR